MPKPTVRAAALSFACMLFSVPLYSQSLRVEGTVRDASSAPVAGAAVSLRTAKSSVTNATGRMGNVLTEANSNLSAARLTGAEAGARLRALGQRLTVRGNFFWNEVSDPIENVTLTSTPSLITRERENLGRARSVGVELDGSAPLTRWTEISGGYQYVAATVVSYPAGMFLVGLDLPEAPRNQFTVQGRYWRPSGLLRSVEGRFRGLAFDDDQNQYLLPRFFALDLLAGHSLGHGVEIFAAFENLFDQRYTIALTPTPMLGPPILARVGVGYRHARTSISG
jgi:outer membrane receptor protein involved in Fe transport